MNTNDITQKPLVKVILKSDIRMGYWVGEPVIREIRKRLTFINPAWEEKVKRGFSTWNTPKELCYLWNSGSTLSMPRGFIRHVLHILKDHDAISA